MRLDNLKKVIACLTLALIIVVNVAPLAQAQTTAQQNRGSIQAALRNAGVGNGDINTSAQASTLPSFTTSQAQSAINNVDDPYSQRAVNQVANANRTTDDQLGCLTGAGGAGNTIAVCLSNIVYYIFVGVFSSIAYIAAFFFDLAVQLSLNSTTYALGFLSTSWEIVRDLANMAFIFILVYIALMVMLQAETAGTIKTLAVVIVIALLVNFSFFFTRVAIDAGNILATQFYNAIPGKPISETSGAGLSTALSGGTAAAKITSFASGGNTKDLTASIMDSLQVQNLLNSPSFQAYVKTNQGFNSSMYLLITLSVIYISMGVILGILAGAFLYAGAKFMMRIVGLWFVLIFSPIAFVARALNTDGSKALFRKWWTYLFHLSLYPAVFLFMFLVLTKFMLELNAPGSNFINGIFAQNLTDSNSFAVILVAIANVAVRLGFVIAMLYLALSIADKVSTVGNGQAQAFSKWMGNNIAGGALGFAGRNTLGILGARMGWARMANSTYDPRNTKIARYSGLTPLLGKFEPTTKKAGGLQASFGEAPPRRSAPSRTPQTPPPSQTPPTPPPNNPPANNPAAPTGTQQNRAQAQGNANTQAHSNQHAGAVAAPRTNPVPASPSAPHAANAALTLAAANIEKMARETKKLREVVNRAAANDNLAPITISIPEPSRKAERRAEAAMDERFGNLGVIVRESAGQSAAQPPVNVTVKVVQDNKPQGEKPQLQVIDGDKKAA